MRPENIRYISGKRSGKVTLPFQTLSRVPYVELGTGWKTSIHFLRVGFCPSPHYLNNHHISKFSVKILRQIKAVS